MTFLSLVSTIVSAYNYPGVSRMRPTSSSEVFPNIFLLFLTFKSISLWSTAFSLSTKLTDGGPPLGNTAGYGPCTIMFLVAQEVRQIGL